jgi:plastocyanin
MSGTNALNQRPRDPRLFTGPIVGGDRPADHWNDPRPAQPIQKGGGSEHLSEDPPTDRSRTGRFIMKHTPLRLAACAVVLAVTGTACGSGDSTDRGSVETPAVTGSGTITLKLIAFQPTQVEIPVGETVTWRQDDVATHTVTSGRVEGSGGTVTATPDGRFDSGNLAKGQDFRFTFPEPGQFAFYCAIHPATMTGVVTVQ